MTNISSYGKVNTVGHSQVLNVFKDIVVIQEKVDGCVTPFTKILTSDLRYIPARDLKVGDKLIGFTDTTNDPRLCESEVTTALEISKPTVKVMHSGGTIEVSTDHPFLVYGKSNNLKEFRQAKDLNPGDRIVFLEYWEEEKSWEAGYLAGQFDGEGSLVRHKNGRILSYYQKCGGELDLVKQLLTNRGFKISVDTRKRREDYLDVGSLVIRQGWPNILRFLGQIRPQRLLSIAKEKVWDNAPTNGMHDVTVIELSYKNTINKVIGLSTTSCTYIAEGLLSHNSQFSLKLDTDGTLHFRSRNKCMTEEVYEKMFQSAIVNIQSIKESLNPEFIYRGEFLNTPKHHAVKYERVPNYNVILFDIESAEFDQVFLTPDEVKREADRLGFDTVPTYFIGNINSSEEALPYLNNKPYLGGEFIEGIVIKNYYRFNPDGKILKAKIVRDDFKEIQQKEWKSQNPSNNDLIQSIISSLATTQRWEKAIQHLEDDGKLLGEPKDIAKLIPEIQRDVEEEELDYIKDKLYNHFKRQIMNGIVKGFPEFYKRKLLGLEDDNYTIHSSLDNNSDSSLD